MKTWRARIIDARARGFFTPEDLALMKSPSTCMAAEVAARCGIRFTNQSRGLWMLGTEAMWRMEDREIDCVEQLLDAIEDEALRLKREGVTG